MSIDARRAAAPSPARDSVEAKNIEIEEELSDALLEESPEGLGPDRREARREGMLVAAVIGFGVLVTIGLLILARPSYPVVLTVAVVGVMYAAASPVLIAMLMRRRDAVVAHRRAHQIMEDAPLVRGKPGRVSG